MATKRSAKELVQQAFDQVGAAGVAGRDQILIWGGVFPASQLDDFLKVWEDALTTHMPWRIIEYVDRFVVQKAGASSAALPESGNLLEHGRLFGRLGDLDLRRDGQVIRWRFIGDAQQVWPEVPQAYSPRSFWDEHGKNAPAFHEVEVRYYLWRAKEQRVDSRWLRSAGLKGEDQRLIQLQYLRDGRVEFVRYMDFEQEVAHG
jgi:hypothetical protein